MWLFYAVLSAFFAGTTAVFAKAGLKKTDPSIVTALRTVIILIFAWCAVFISEGEGGVLSIGWKTAVYLVLSGASTAALWLFYFKALSCGEVKQVAPIDKICTVFVTVAGFFFGERISLPKILSIAAIIGGVYIMATAGMEKKEKKKPKWLIFALISAACAALTALLGKAGLSDIDPDLATAMRTLVVLVISWAVVFIKKKHKLVKETDRKELSWIILSGIATGLSWLFYFRALRDGDVGRVAPIEKLSIVFTVIFAAVFLKEKCSKKEVIGLIIITAGTLLLLI